MDINTIIFSLHSVFYTLHQFYNRHLVATRSVWKVIYHLNFSDNITSAVSHCKISIHHKRLLLPWTLLLYALRREWNGWLTHWTTVVIRNPTIRALNMKIMLAGKNMKHIFFDKYFHAHCTTWIISDFFLLMGYSQCSIWNIIWTTARRIRLSLTDLFTIQRY